MLSFKKAEKNLFYNVLACCVSWISITVQVARKQSNICLCIDMSRYKYLLSSIFFETQKISFCVCETNYSPGWIEKGTWIGSWASCSAAHGRWRGHGSCQEDCKSPGRIIVWQRTRKTNWAAYCHLWSEQNTKLLPTGTWMENTSKGISQSFFLFFFLKDPNSFVHSPENNSVLHALSVSFTNRLEDLRPKWRSGWVLVIVL